MPQQFIPGLIILLSLITATGLPWQLCRRTGQPYLINLLMSAIIVLVHLWVARGSTSDGGRGCLSPAGGRERRADILVRRFVRHLICLFPAGKREPWQEGSPLAGSWWKICWTKTIPAFGLILWSILRGFLIHPHGFRIEDGWFSAIGLCFLLDRSPLKHLLQKTIITMSPLAIISLYGWLCPAGVITGLLVIAFAVSFVSVGAQKQGGNVGADPCVCPLRGNNQGVEGIRRGRPMCLPSLLRTVCDAWAGSHKSSRLCVSAVKCFATAVFMAAFIGISLHLLLFDPGIKKQGRILFDIGHGDTSGPQWGYSTDIDKSADAGHGRLLDFLRAYGYRIETRTEPLSGDVLKKYDTLLLIMPSKAYTRREIRNIKKFVQDGGGLMVIGDHTNVDDVMASLNPVLEGFGVKLRFDIVRVDKQIKANIFAAHCPMFQGINPVRETAIGNGASLSLYSPSGMYSPLTRGIRGVYSPLIRGVRGVLPAMPILSVGYGSFSDIGDLKTGPDQAYLGNGMLDKNERVGDHILAASGKYGQGRLIVFGDSSYFQNLALYRNYNFAYQCFEWLNRKNIDTKKWAMSLFLVLLLLSAAVIVYGQGIHRLGYVMILGIIITQCISSAANHHSYPVIDYKKLGQRVLFDFAHYPEHRTYWEDTDNYPTSLDSLVHQTLRVGLHPSLRYRGRLNAQTLNGYDALVVSSPNLPYTRGEVQAIQQWVHSGGGLLVIEGAREQACINPLLEPFKIRLDDKPLGTYYCEKDTDGNDFKIPMSFTTQKFIQHPITQGVSSIWFMTPVAVKGGLPLAYVNDYPTMVYKKYGAGRVVVVGDDLFFANYISEGEKGVVDYDKVLLNWNLMRWLAGEKPSS